MCSAPPPPPPPVGGGADATGTAASVGRGDAEGGPGGVDGVGLGAEMTALEFAGFEREAEAFDAALSLPHAGAPQPAGPDGGGAGLLASL